MVPFLSLSVLLDLVNVCICLVYLGIEVYLENYDLFAMIVLAIGLAGAISGFLKYSLIIGIMTFMKGAVMLVLLVENPLSPDCPAWVKGVTTLFLGCNLHRSDEDDDGFVHVQCAVNQDGRQF